FSEIMKHFLTASYPRFHLIFVLGVARCGLYAPWKNAQYAFTRALRWRDDVNQKVEAGWPGLLLRHSDS
ncbi:MAG TPA: hypothetical protein VJB17_00040, partial [Patescibacteria group bacterium]|nr:hypothetical protein [Patescibacteria group bacterium]